MLLHLPTSHMLIFNGGSRFAAHQQDFSTYTHACCLPSLLMARPAARMAPSCNFSQRPTRQRQDRSPMAMNTPWQADSEPRLSQAAGLHAARVGHAQSQVQAAAC